MTYKEKYYEIINSGLKEKPENGYYEGHHIIPKSICPLLKKSQSNIIYLTAKNHFLAHYYIWKWFKEELHEKKWARSMCYAFNMMKRIISKSDNVEELSKLYDEVKREMGKIVSERMKGIIPWNKGKSGIYTEETRRKIGDNNGSHRQEVRDKISKTRIERRCGIGNKNAVGSKGHKGLKWITNGIIEKTIPIGENPPEGFRFGRCYNKYSKKENA